jgi:predicted RecB family endonuclease
VPVITVPKALRERLGEEGVEALVEPINAAYAHARDDTLTLAAEKFERRLAEVGARFETRLTEVEAKFERRLTEEVARLEALISQEVTRLEAKISQEVARLEAKIETKISEVKADLIRWMFLFWVGQLGAILGILLMFFRR